MKCPDCGDAEQQERLGPDSQLLGHTGYRCPKCGRLYVVPTDIADLTHRLAEMKARLHVLGLEMGSLAREIADAEAVLLELREQRQKDP
jgi:transposase-like protein